MNRIKRLIVAASLLCATTAQANIGIWATDAEIADRPMSGAAWTALKAQADKAACTPALSNQEDGCNVVVLAQALAYKRTGNAAYRTKVISALTKITNSGTYSGRALALARELGAYVIAADIIDYDNFDPAASPKFKAKVKALISAPTTEAGTIIQCSENRPNNWGTHCLATRLAVARYLGDSAQVARIATVFKGWLGDRVSYAGFKYGDLSWQANSSKPVGVNPKGSVKSGHNIDGVLPDDQRRAGSFTWPPPKENYVYEALQGALATSVMLSKGGFADVWGWQDKAMLRAFAWLYNVNNFPATGDDTWEPWIVNKVYVQVLPTKTPTTPGKMIGYTDWLYAK